MDQNDVGVAIHASFSSAKALARTVVLPHAVKLKHILSSSVDLQNTSRRDASANGGKRKGEIFFGGGFGGSRLEPALMRGSNVVGFREDRR